MQVSSSLNSSNTTAPISSYQHHHSSPGISNTPSSIEMRLQAQASSGGFCSCITDFIERICRFLGISSSQANTTTSNVVNFIEDKITRGKNILTAHLQSPRIRDDGQRSAIVVIMNFNSHTVASYRPASVQQSTHGLNLLKDQLAHLISRQHDVPENAELQIKTVYFKKNNDNTYAYHDQEGPMNTTSAGSLDLPTILRIVTSWNCSREEQHEIICFLRQL